MSARAMKEQQKADEPQPIDNVAAQCIDPVLADVVEWG